MSGKPGFNIAAFDQARDWLEEHTNLEVISPPDLDSPEHKQKCLEDVDGATPPDGVTWIEYLTRDLQVIEREVDVMVLLPDWWKSAGSRIEVQAGLKLGLDFYEFNCSPVPRGRPEFLEPWTHEEVRGALHDPDGVPGYPPIDDKVHDEMLARIGLDDDGETPLSPQSAEPLKDATQVFIDGKKIGEWINATSPGEVRVTNEKTGGQKGRKPQRFELLPYGSLARIAEVYAHGAEKYEQHNWRKGYEWSLSYGAMQRHLAAWWEGEDTDPESGLSHLAHAGFHILGLLHFDAHDKYEELDDRPEVTHA